MSTETKLDEKAFNLFVNQLHQQVQPRMYIDDLKCLRRCEVYAGPVPHSLVVQVVEGTGPCERGVAAYTVSADTVHAVRGVPNGVDIELNPEPCMGHGPILRIRFLREEPMNLFMNNLNCVGWTR